MSISQLTTLSRACLIIGVILVIVEVILFFVLDINKAWHIVTGRQMKNKPEKEKKIRQGKSSSQRLSTKKLQALQKQSAVTTPLKQEQPEEMATEVLNQGNNSVAGTAPLHIDSNSLVAETMPLYINPNKPVNDETTILGMRDTESLQEVTTIGQTVELPKQEDDMLTGQQSAEKPEVGVFRSKYNVTFTHTEVKI